MTRGYLTIARLGGAPIRLHWSLPLGALFLGGFRFVPAFWLGFALLILIHELGHALLVLRFRLGLSEIAVHGFGGYCRHERSGSAFEEAVVAWGGVLAQLAALLVCQALLLLLGPPSSMHGALLAHVFTSSNLWIIGFNLLPIEPFDGAKAWRILPLLFEKLRGKDGPARGGFGQRRSVQDELRALERMSTQSETPDQRADRLVRELISRTTQSKDR